MDYTLILVLIVFFALFFLFAQFLLRFLINYKLTEEYLLIKIFFFIPIISIRLEDIEEVGVYRSFDRELNLFNFTTLRYGNRLWIDRIVLIKTKKTIFFPFVNKIVVSPSYPEKFVDEIQAKIS